MGEDVLEVDVLIPSTLEEDMSRFAGGAVEGRVGGKLKDAGGAVEG